jgi:hypothetical protein
MDISKLKKRLGEISNKNKKNNLIWKPAAGTQNIRIVPYKGNPDNPFIELLFHYDLNGKTYLSPASFDRKDPIVEFANQLKRTGDQEDYKMGAQLMPKMRIFAPVIVRGEENQGVRFWGFGKQVYQSLLGIVSDEDYGDISDMKEGNDISVVYLSKEETGKNFPETQIRPRPKKTVVGDDAVMTAIKSQPNINEIYEEPSYEDLKEAMERHLNPEGDVAEGDVSVEAGVSSNSSATEQAAAPKASTSVEETANDFDTLFNQ